MSVEWEYRYLSSLFCFTFLKNVSSEHVNSEHCLHIKYLLEFHFYHLLFASLWNWVQSLLGFLNFPICKRRSRAWIKPFSSNILCREHIFTIFLFKKQQFKEPGHYHCFKSAWPELPCATRANLFCKAVSQMKRAQGIAIILHLLVSHSWPDIGSWSAIAAEVQY
jgi:hypothetical protein